MAVSAVAERARTIQEALLEHLDADPAGPSIAFVDERGGFRWLSRHELLGRASHGASVLSELGLERGRVGIIVSAEPEECASAVLSMLLLGAVPLLVAPPVIQGVNSSLKDVLLDVVRRSAAAVVVLPREMQASAGELRRASPLVRLELGYERLVAGTAEPLRALNRRPDDVAALQLTSGTTGFPRIAVWQQQAVLAALRGMARGMGTGASDVCLNWTPLYHDMGLVNNFLFCLVHGLPLALLSPRAFVRRPALWLRSLHDTGATITWSPNFGFALAAERARDSELEGVRLDHVRGFWNAAERVHLATFERFHRRFERLGVKWEALKANFGCVETIGGATFTDPAGGLVRERVERDALRADGLARTVDESRAPADTEWIVGCGRACPGVEVGAFGAQGERLPDGVVGELAVRSPSHLVEYLGQPEETARTLRGELVFTGDLCYMRGPELFWTGRKSEVINLQGRKLDPSELERVLFAAPGLRKGSFAAFGREDAERGTEVLVVLAEVEPDAVERCAELAAELRRDVATQLGVTIEELVLVGKGVLTKTSSGKRRHRHFRDLYLAGRLEILHRSQAGRLG